MRCDICGGFVVDTVEFIPSEGRVEERTCINCGRAPLHERRERQAVAAAVLHDDTVAHAGKQRRRQPSHAGGRL